MYSACILTYQQIFDFTMTSLHWNSHVSMHVWCNQTTMGDKLGQTWLSKFHIDCDNSPCIGIIQSRYAYIATHTLIGLPWTQDPCMHWCAQCSPLVWFMCVCLFRAPVIRGTCADRKHQFGIFIVQLYTGNIAGYTD